jgi:hypothetical protein
MPKVSVNQSRLVIAENLKNCSNRALIKDILALTFVPLEAATEM